MPIRPRYQRVSALHRQFFNREGLLGVYDEELRSISDRPGILNFVGVGGIGKSRLLHADIHRKNMILTDQEVTFLDWEFALWGDPVYDLADHIHKMSYRADELRAVTEGWERAAPEECRHQWRSGLDYYLAYEAVKSVVVDTVRWGRRIAAAQGEDERRTLSHELAGKVAAASPHWAAGAAPGPEDLKAAVERWLS